MALIRSNGRLKAVAIAEADQSVAPVDPDEYLYRSLARDTTRNLTPITHDRALDVCSALHRENPLGHRITEINRDYIVGDGVTWEARNPHVADVVHRFWTDDVNKLAHRLPEFALEYGLYGELCLEVFVGEVSGFVRLGYVDPAQIDHVSHVKGNPLVLDEVALKGQTGKDGRKLSIIREQDDGELTGDVLFVKTNSVSNATRGWPDLLHVADWLDFYDQLLWEMAERSKHMRAFIWDVLIKGADDKYIQEWLRKHGTAPKSGTVRAHNEQIEWSAVAPQLGSYELAKEAEVLLEHIGAGVGLPKHWLASAGDVNRATALEMGAPTVRRLAHRQRRFLDAVHYLLRFVLERAMDSGKLRNRNGLVQAYGENGKRGKWFAPWDLVELHAPEVSLKDQARAGDLLVNVAEALQIAESMGWMSKHPIRRAIAVALGQMGVDYDPATDDIPDLPADPDRPADPSKNGHASDEAIVRALRRLARTGAS